MATKGPSATRIVTGIFSNNKAAADAIGTLVTSGFEERALSVIGADTEQFGAINAQLKKNKPDLSLIFGSLFGAIFGAICGWLAVEYIPAARYFTSAIPLMSSLTGAAAGAYLGMVIGNMSTDEEPSDVASGEATSVKRGILVSAFVRDSASRFKAENVFAKCGAEKILVVRTEEEASSANAA